MMVLVFAVVFVAVWMDVAPSLIATLNHFPVLIRSELRQLLQECRKVPDGLVVVSPTPGRHSRHLDGWPRWRLWRLADCNEE